MKKLITLSRCLTTFLLLHDNRALALSSNKKTKHVIVVGGGVGGLATAARISSKFNDDVKVTILEKNSSEFVGGRCGSMDIELEEGVFRYERGPSLLLLKDVYDELFRDCLGGNDDVMVTAEDYGLHWKQCIPAYKVIFEDGDEVDMGFPAHIVECDREMMELYERSRKKMDEWEASSEGASRWDAYMKATSAFLDCGWPNFIEERFDVVSFPNFIVEALKDGAMAWPLFPHSTVLDNFFTSRKMKAMASFQDLYVGLEPYKNDNEIGGGVLTSTAPAVFGLLAALELHPTNKRAGVFAPIGGFRSVGKAFEKLATDMGVRIEYEKTVTKVTNDGVFYSDTSANNKFVKADLVIVNADLPYAQKCLLGPNTEQSMAIENMYDWDDKYRYSSGVIAFHWSLNKSIKCLNTHNVFLYASKNEASWKTLRENSKLVSGDPFNFYVHRATATDKSAAPTGCDSIMVLVPCATLKRNNDWAKLNRNIAVEKYQGQFDDAYVQSIKQAVLDRMSVIDELDNLEYNIIHEEIDTPGTYADLYNLAAGTPFALVSLLRFIFCNISSSSDVRRFFL